MPPMRASGRTPLSTLYKPSGPDHAAKTRQVLQGDKDKAPFHLHTLMSNIYNVFFMVNKQPLTQTKKHHKKLLQSSKMNLKI